MTHIIDSLFKIDKNQLTNEQYKKIKKQLTISNYDYKNNKRNGYSNKGVPKQEYLYTEKENYLIVPRAFGIKLHNSIKGSLIDNRTICNTNFESIFEPRDKQQIEIINKTYQFLISKFGAILVAPCGAGKTVMALQLAHLLGQKTVVIVHKEFLIDQWKKEISNILPKTSIGIVWGKQCDIQDITIVMLQSLLTKRIYPDILFQCGLVIGDEAHYHGAKKWRNALIQFSAKYLLLLSATPKRTDGRHIILEHQAGKYYVILKHYGLKPQIKQIFTTVDFPKKQYTLWNNKINKSKILTLISKVENRNNRIVQICLNAFKADRHILVLSHRLEQLDILEEKIKKISKEIKTIQLVGAIKKQKNFSWEKALEEASKTNIIFATYNMVKDSFNMPTLSVVILATPMGNIIQSIGRILRKLKNKKKPIVIDIVDSKIDYLNGLAQHRMRTYQKLKYEII